jgi:hypothetical protein
MKTKLIIFLFFLILFSGCYRWKSSSGGGEHVGNVVKRTINISDIALPEGYQIEVAAQDLTFPTGVAFDDKGIAYVTEAGYSYGEVFKTPKLLRINDDGTSAIIASGENNGPWNGIWYYDGNFYVSEGGEMQGGKILKIDMQGKITSVIDGLPSLGDHHTNGPVVNNGFIYFGQGTATNSAVTGEDNQKFGWLKRNPEFHDIPCEDIKLAGTNFPTDNVLNPGSGKVLTGAYLPYGTPSKPGQVINGKIPCSGSVMRIPLMGGKTELVAWGFRNPFGLSFDSKNQLYVTDNGYDDRGSRPVWGSGDYLWKVDQGKWYGWPDYSGGHPLYEGLKVPGKGQPARILEDDPGEPPRPSATMGVHSSSDGFDFSRSEKFGFAGEAFIAQFGDMAPNAGKVLKPVGFKVVRVNTETGVITDFLRNAKENAPASRIKNGGIERPVAARFSPDGNYLYVVDFGIMTVSKAVTLPVEGTGVIWKISKKGIK